MRHGNHGNHLGHSSAQHKANMQNLASSLFEHGLIRTTLAKAKALRGVAEPLITRAKVDTLANRRLVYARLRNRASVTKLFTELGPHYKARAGGYTRVLRCGFRPGDMAPMAYIELVDRPQTAAVTPESTDTDAKAASAKATKPAKAAKAASVAKGPKAAKKKAV